MLSAFSRRVLLSGLVCLLGGSVSFAELSQVSVFLDQSNEFADGQMYGRVDVTANSQTGVVSFHVEAFSNPEYDVPGWNQGFDSFGFNFSGIADRVWTWSWSKPTNWISRTNRRQDGFGLFDIIIQKGPGGSRQEPLDFEFTLPNASDAVVSNFIDLSRDQADQGNQVFAAHYAGFNAGDSVSSHFIGGSTPHVVPLPSALLLGGFGLSLVCRLRRRLA